MLKWTIAHEEWTKSRASTGGKAGGNPHGSISGSQQLRIAGGEGCRHYNHHTHDMRCTDLFSNKCRPETCKL